MRKAISEQQVIEAMHDIAELLDCELISHITSETVLLESGLDSLGFAMLVAKLEEDFGYDPFVLMDDAVYPKTLAEFVSLYKRYQDHGI